MPFSFCYYRDRKFTLSLPLSMSVFFLPLFCLNVLAFGEPKSASLYFLIINLNLSSRVTQNKFNYLFHLTAFQISGERNHIFPLPSFSQVNHSRFFHLFLIWHGFQILPSISPSQRPSWSPTVNKFSFPNGIKYGIQDWAQHLKVLKLTQGQHRTYNLVSILPLMRLATYYSFLSVNIF